MLAEELDLPVHTHLHETAGEVAESMTQHGTRPLARLERLGLVTERLIAVHAVHLDSTEIALLAAARGVGRPLSGFEPQARPAVWLRLPALMAAGVNLGIGTDGAASNDRLDMYAETRLAALLAKGVALRCRPRSRRRRRWRPPHSAAHVRSGLSDGSVRSKSARRRTSWRLRFVSNRNLAHVSTSSRSSFTRPDANTSAMSGSPGSAVVRKRQVLANVEQGEAERQASALLAWQNRCRQILPTAGTA